jgi:Clp amino terminal domain, pathogenicity island component
MFELDCADLVVIAGQVLGVGPHAALDQLDTAAARAALTEAALAAAALADGALAADPRTGALDGRATAATAATGLMRALLRHRPFPGHHQQVAVAAALQFLALNGWQADLDPPGTALAVVEGLACGQLSPADAAAWLSPRLSPYSAQPAREAPMRTLRSRATGLIRAADPRPRAGIQTPVTGFIPFTDDAGKVVIRAREEEIRLGLDYPGPEQFLVALVDTGQGVAGQALERLGIRPDAVRQQLTQLTQVTQVTSQGQPLAAPGPYTPLAERVMPQAVGQVMAHGHDYIGTEHILLALFHVADDTAARALTSLGAGESEVRGAVTAVLGETGRISHVAHRVRKPVSRDDEIRRLRREVARLSDLLREHGIEPGAGDRKSA